MKRSPVTLAGLILIFISAALAGDAPQPTAVDQLQFQQKNAQAQMQELQERMYRLAELTREAEPDDAGRLLMAVRKAREQLIIEQMKETYDLLGRSDLAD